MSDNWKNRILLGTERPPGTYIILYGAVFSSATARPLRRSRVFIGFLPLFSPPPSSSLSPSLSLSHYPCTHPSSYFDRWSSSLAPRQNYAVVPAYIAPPPFGAAGYNRNKIRRRIRAVINHAVAIVLLFIFIVPPASLGSLTVSFLCFLFFVRTHPVPFFISRGNRLGRTRPAHSAFFLPSSLSLPPLKTAPRASLVLNFLRLRSHPPPPLTATYTTNTRSRSHTLLHVHAYIGNGVRFQ